LQDDLLPGGVGVAGGRAVAEVDVNDRNHLAVGGGLADARQIAGLAVEQQAALEGFDRPAVTAHVVHHRTSCKSPHPTVAAAIATLNRIDRGRAGKKTPGGSRRPFMP
jgi:hypothetical protein